ncbi:MAG: hypothetical protein IJL34_06260 [Treponema sp.]|nr:hypothetical protein [Treponema sp.]
MNNELTGIERQLVLQYLMDGNVPVTVTEILPVPSEEEKGKIKSIAGVFPVAVRHDQMEVLDQGIILLKNPAETVKSFDGKNVKVQFYFNKLGLYFETQMKSVRSGDLALVIPAVIKKVEERVKKSSDSFNAVIYWEGQGSNDIKCGLLDDYPTFVTPKWSDVPEEDQVTAKRYLENAVMHSKTVGKSIGNGLFLLSVCRFLAQKNESQESSIQDRKNPPDIIYIDSERIVFAGPARNNIFTESGEYALILGFPIASGPIKERTVYITARADSIFTDDDNTKYCAVCDYKSIKEEDQSFLEDKRV